MNTLTLNYRFHGRLPYNRDSAVCPLSCPLALDNERRLDTFLNLYIVPKSKKKNVKQETNNSIDILMKSSIGF